MRFVLLAGAVVATVLFVLGTVVKVSGISEQTSSILDNFRLLRNIDLESVIQQNLYSGTLDAEGHLAGFEYPATILMGLANGASPMYGEGIVEGALSALPAFLRPPGLRNERQAIFRHFYGYGLLRGDIIGVPLTSGVASWGIILGPLIYVVIALYCLLMWRVVQSSPRLFVAYLMAGAAPGDLFWENALGNIKLIGFAWLALWVLGPVLMPRWLPTSSNGEVRDHPENIP